METDRKRGRYAKTAERQKAIIRAARDSFAEHGVTGSSLRDVAMRAGIAHASVLYHFPSKDELLLAVLAYSDEEELQLSTEREDNAAGGKTFLRDLLLRHQQRPELIRLWADLTSAASRTDHAAHEYFVTRYEGARARTVAFLQRLQDQGRLRKGLDPEHAAVLFLAMLDGMQTQWLLDTGLDILSPLDQFFDLILEPEK